MILVSAPQILGYDDGGPLDWAAAEIFVSQIVSVRRTGYLQYTPRSMTSKRINGHELDKKSVHMIINHRSEDSRTPVIILPSRLKFLDILVIDDVSLILSPAFTGLLEKCQPK